MSRDCRGIAGSGARELAVEQAARCRRIATAIRAEVARQASALSADRAADAEAAARRYDAEAEAWDAAAAGYRRWPDGHSDLASERAAEVAR